jgi:DNA-binding CsgD family transcriptional regulator/tetratricopeptide (TPR) repeat protein
VAWVQADYNRARTLLEESLLVYGELGDKWGCARSLHGLGETMLGQGNYAIARTLFEESLSLFRQLGDKLHGTFALLRLGTLAWYQNEYERARKLLEESLKLFGEVENKWGCAYSLLNLGGVACDRGEFEQALWLLEESLSLFREVGYKAGIAGALNYLGLVKLQQGEFEQAKIVCQESFELRRELGDKSGVGHCLEILASVALAQGAAKEAARLLGVADALRQALNAPLLPILHNQHEQTLGMVRTRLGKTEFAKAWMQGQNTDIYDLRTQWVPAIYDYKKEEYDFTTHSIEATTSADKEKLNKTEGVKPLKAVGIQKSSIMADAAQPSGRNRQSSIAATSGAHQSSIVNRQSSIPNTGLTAREIEVLRLVAQGLTNAQVAQQLMLASRTVNVHLTSIYGKLGVNSRVGATRYVYDHNLM